MRRRLRAASEHRRMFAADMVQELFAINVQQSSFMVPGLGTSGGCIQHNASKYRTHASSSLLPNPDGI